MSGQMQIAEMYEQVQSERAIDYVGNRRQMSVNYDGRFNIDLGGQYQFPVNDYALEQMNTSIANGFKNYASWLIENGRHQMYLDNVNDAFAKDDRRSQLRTVERDGRQYVRAVVSDRFKAIDDKLLFSSVLPVVAEHSLRFKALGGNRTDIKTYLKFISRDPVFSVNVDNRERNFHVGFIGYNSEVGASKMVFSLFFSDAFCENGVIFSKMIVADVSYVHRGMKIATDFGPVLGDRFRQAEQESIRASIAEAAQLACTSDGWERAKDVIEASANRKITGDRWDVIDTIGKEVQLGKKDVENVKLFMEPDAMSQFGIQSAITRYAQEVGDYDKRIALEEAGGAVSAINDKMWNAINALN